MIQFAQIFQFILWYGSVCHILLEGGANPLDLFDVMLIETYNIVGRCGIDQINTHLIGV